MVALPQVQRTDPSELPADLAVIASRVEARVKDLLQHERKRWADLDPSVVAPIDALERLVLTGGKRLRPAFCHWGYVAGGGDPDDDAVIAAGAAFELLQGFALIHDDVMDGSASRRGAPAVHRQFLEQHDSAEWAGESRRFGEGVAILVGDLALVYADQLLPSGPVEVGRLWNELRVELNVGQYLDLIGTVRSQRDRDASRRIARYKSGKYTIERPLQVGAALAGAHDELYGPLGRFGDPLGEAFQLRDDVLGAFGDSRLTGKPVGDDLREGKPTLLLAIAHENASNAQLEVLARVGNSELTNGDVADVQQVLEDTGALSGTEAQIAQLAATAIDKLGEIGLTDQVHTALTDLAHFVVARSS